MPNYLLYQAIVLTPKEDFMGLTKVYPFLLGLPMNLWQQTFTVTALAILQSIKSCDEAGARVENDDIDFIVISEQPSKLGEAIYANWTANFSR